MMAYDPRSTPEPRPLGEATTAALHDAALRIWEQPDLGEEPLHAALAAMVAEARTRSLRAEEVIVAFKEILAALPLHAGERRLEASHFRERLVTLCIKAYYGA